MYLSLVINFSKIFALFWLKSNWYVLPSPWYLKIYVTKLNFEISKSTAKQHVVGWKLKIETLFYFSFTNILFVLIFYSHNHITFIHFYIHKKVFLKPMFHVKCMKINHFIPFRVLREWFRLKKLNNCSENFWSWYFSKFLSWSVWRSFSSAINSKFSIFWTVEKLLN